MPAGANLPVPNLAVSELRLATPSPRAGAEPPRKVNWGFRTRITPRDASADCQAGTKTAPAEAACEKEAKCDVFGREGPPSHTAKSVLLVRVDAGRGTAAAAASPVASAVDDESSAEMAKRQEVLHRVTSMRKLQAPQRVNSILNLTVGGPPLSVSRGVGAGGAARGKGRIADAKPVCIAQLCPTRLRLTPCTVRACDPPRRKQW